MRLLDGDSARERSLLTEIELMRPPQVPPGSCFGDVPHETGEGPLRKNMHGACCKHPMFCGHLGPRRFPDFGTQNQCLLPHHFANLCMLGAEMTLPAVQHAKRLRRSEFIG